MKPLISGSSLKIIAMVSMLIDHIGAVIIPIFIRNQDIIPYSINFMLMYNIFRAIGRIAFPIFCFLLVEGYVHSHNRIKYAIRLLVFAIISEPFFDLAFNNNVFTMVNQNVILTLFLGIICIAGIDYLDSFLNEASTSSKMLLISILKIVDIGVLAYIANLLDTDYSATGVVCISLMYIFRESRALASLLGITVLALMFGENEYYAYFAIIPILYYNNSRGLKLKYIFYVFYPLHLYILYLISKNIFYSFG